MQIVGWKKFFSLIGYTDPQPKKYVGWESQPISDAQKKYLRTLGLGWSGLVTKGQASFVISVAEGRKRRGLATPGQLKALASISVDAKELTTAEATKKLKACGYISHCPEYILAARACG